MHTTRGVLLLLALSASSLADSDNSAETTAVTMTTRQMECITDYSPSDRGTLNSTYCSWRMILDRRGDKFKKQLLSPFTPVPSDIELQYPLVFGDLPTLKAAVVYCKCYEPVCNVDDEGKFESCVKDGITFNNYSSTGWEIAELSKMVEAITRKTIAELMTTTTTSSTTSTTTTTTTTNPKSASDRENGDSTLAVIAVVVVAGLLIVILVIVIVILSRKKKSEVVAKTPESATSKPKTRDSSTPKTDPNPTSTEPKSTYRRWVSEIVDDIIHRGVKTISAVYESMLQDDDEERKANEKKRNAKGPENELAAEIAAKNSRIVAEKNSARYYANGTFVNATRTIVLAQDPTPKTIDEFLTMIFSLRVNTIVAVGEESKDRQAPWSKYVPSAVGGVRTFGRYRLMLVMQNPLEGAELTHSRFSMQDQTGTTILVDHVWDGLGAETSLPNVDRMAAVGRLLLLENALRSPDAVLVVHGATRWHRAAGYCLFLDMLRSAKHSLDEARFITSSMHMRTCCKNALCDPNQYIAAQAAFLRVMAQVGVTTEAKVAPFIADYNASDAPNKTQTTSVAATPNKTA